jgi:hypothetical protein
MLGLKYDTDEARRMGAAIAEFMRDESYAASAAIAQEKGAFPLFDAKQFLAAPRFASRLPAELQKKIAAHGMRNSHLLSIAPTGTISLAFADNASNGIEPPYSWTYQRKKRMPDDTHRTYDVEDHAWRLFRHSGGEMDKLPAHFRDGAGDFRARSHAHGRGHCAVRRFGDQQNRQRAGRLSVPGIRRPLFPGVEGGPERHCDLPPEFSAGQRAVRHLRRRRPRSRTI